MLCVPPTLQVVTGNRIWKQRVVDIGVVSAQQAMDWGFRWGGLMCALLWGGRVGVGMARIVLVCRDVGTLVYCRHRNSWFVRNFKKLEQIALTVFY